MLDATAIYAGSFDPPTTGHLWMIREGAKLFKNLRVAVGTNPNKKCAYSVEQRIAWLTEITRTESHRHIVVSQFNNAYLVDVARELGAAFILRGVRNEQDYEYERAMRHINGDLRPSITTVFLMPPRDLSEVSSSVVKGLIGPEGWRDVVKNYLPPCVFERICHEHD